MAGVVDHQSVNGFALRKRTPEDDDEVDAVIRSRTREDTAPRRHVFLRQTVPPSDPVVREVERRRSGRDD